MAWGDIGPTQDRLSRWLTNMKVKHMLMAWVAWIVIAAAFTIGFLWIAVKVIKAAWSTP